ncbi:hypothetical protein B0H11DRAFT_2194356 [Mycena galericulata]|nr:hypothetical protein B0H11DRAFT_2194356 [Mycena galericulata]
MDEIQVNSPQVEAGLVPMQGASAMFHSAHNFSISGGEFSHTVNFISNASLKTRETSGLEDFREIRLGDLNLRKEKGMGRTVGALGWNRRVYAARVHGCTHPMTVAVYEGEDIEEKWLEEVKKYEGLRLPTLVQVFGIVKSKQLYATVYEDDLIPINEFRRGYRDSEISSALLEYYVDIELQRCKRYLEERSCFSQERTLWMRGTTKNLCLELSKSYDWTAALTSGDFLLHPPTRFTGLAQETIWMASFELKEFHDVMVRYAGASVWPHISPHHLCRPGAILFLLDMDMDPYQNSNEMGISPGGEVAHIPGLQVHNLGWVLSSQYRNFESIRTEMGNGWTRFCFPRIPAPCKDFINRIILCAERNWAIETAWLSQANYIFSGYSIKNDLDSYGTFSSTFFIHETSYWVSLLDSGHPPTEITLSGGIFLFLAPIGAMQNSDLGGLVYPVPAFWSFEPSGSHGLPEDGTALGLPILSVSARISGSQWSTKIYHGLVEFHRCKGFNPDSLDVTLHLGLPLYQPSLHNSVYPHND